MFRIGDWLQSNNCEMPDIHCIDATNTCDPSHQKKIVLTFGFLIKLVVKMFVFKAPLGGVAPPTSGVLTNVSLLPNPCMVQPQIPVVPGWIGKCQNIDSARDKDSEDLLRS